MATKKATETVIEIPVGDIRLEGNLSLPPGVKGLVVFAHGSGSSRHSPRNRSVAESLNNQGFGTLLFDLLTSAEDTEDRMTAALRFDIPMLADRLITVGEWIGNQAIGAGVPMGFFGASTGAAAALIAAARLDTVRAVVSRGGRPDLAKHALPDVKAPTLLIVGGNDDVVIEMNRGILDDIGSDYKNLTIIPGATHLFEEPGKLEEVANVAAEWFDTYLK